MARALPNQPKTDAPATNTDAGGDTAVAEHNEQPKPIASDALAAANAEIASLRAQLAQQQTRVPPVNRPAREMHTDDVREPGLPDIQMPALGAGLPDHEDTQVLLPGAHMDREYLDALAFNEEPVMIRIEPGQDENAAMTVDCWVQGKGAEVFDTRTSRWLELNCLPVGIVVTTRRKYVEVLARSKTMKVRTPDHGDGKNIDNNNVTRSNSRSVLFSVIKDTDKGVAWLTRILNESF